MDEDEECVEEFVPRPLSWHDLFGFPLAAMGDMLKCLGDIFGFASSLFVADRAYRRERNEMREEVMLSIESL